MQSLCTEKDLLVLHTTTQSWGEALKPANFFAGLHAAMCKGLGLEEKTPKNFGFDELHKFIEIHADKYRFVVMVDEFDALFENPKLDSAFLANLRTLGYEPRYRLAWLTASHAPLDGLCKQHRRAESSFWNIFGLSYTLGLLSEFEALELILKPCQTTLGRAPEAAPLQRLTDTHPALLQMVLREAWEALAVGREMPDCCLGLRPYYEKLWQDRSEADCRSDGVLRKRGDKTMKLEFDPQADAAYFEISIAEVAVSKEIEPGIIVDYNEYGHIVDIEVLHVSKRGLPSLPHTEQNRIAA